MLFPLMKSFYQTFQVKPQDTIGKNLYTLGKEQWNIPSLKNLLEDVLPKKTDLVDYIVEDDFPIIGHKKMSNT